MDNVGPCGDAQTSGQSRLFSGVLSGCLLQEGILHIFVLASLAKPSYVTGLCSSSRDPFQTSLIEPAGPQHFAEP